MAQSPTIGAACPMRIDADALALFRAWTARWDRLGAQIVNTCRIWIPGRPVPKGRPRAWRDPRSGRARLVTPQATRDYERHVADVCSRVGVDVPESWDGIVMGAHVCSVHGRSRREQTRGRAALQLKGRHRADLDNICKSVLDGVQRSPLMVDDSHVVGLESWRMIAPAEEPRVQGVLLGLVWAQVAGL
jgi:Holliday junction resolvase RusA-like endonuclease